MKKKCIFVFLALFFTFSTINVYAFTNDKKVLRIGGDIGYPPYEFIDKDGEYKGFNIDMVSAVAEEIGYKIEFVPLTWSEAIDALREGRIDAIQGANKTNDREEEFIFSKSYTANDQVIFTLNDTTYISSLYDLKGRNVAVQKGDIGEEILNKIGGINTISSRTNKEAIDLLFNKKVEAFVGNRLVGFYYLQKQKMLNKIKVTGQTIQHVEYGLMTLPENKEIISVFNEGLKSVKRKKIDEEIKKKWFGEAIVYSPDSWRKITFTIITSGFIISIGIGGVLFVNRRLKSKVKERTVELEEANKALKENEERYRRFIESCPDAIFAHREDNIILFVNDEGRRLLEAKSKKDIIGKNIDSFLGDTSYLDKVRNKDYYGKAPYEKVIKTIRGESVDVEIRRSLIDYEGEQSFLTIVTNVSERKKLVDAIEYDKIKTEFFANISHELRTPLNVILASLQLMERKMDNCEEECKLKIGFNNNIENIKHNSHRLLRLVNNLIDITKIDSGYVSLNLKNGNIVDVIENTVTSVIEYAHLKNLNVVFDTDVEELIMAYDEDKIERIMLNLLSNAVKFTEENGEILVDIKTFKDKIEISVIDSGVGIPKDKLLVIFERFRQVNKSLTRSSEGSGIGLSLVKSLVEMLNGDILVKSKYGKGTTFVVILPRTIVKDEDQTDNRSFIKTSEMANIEFSDIT